jgi:serine/threonine protein kinase
VSAYCGQCQVGVDGNESSCVSCSAPKPLHGWPTDRLLGVSLKDRYRVDARLGGGPLESVYAGTDLTDRAAVTIHTLRSTLLTDKVHSALFTERVERLKQLDSAYSARVISTVCEAGVNAYILETLGENLDAAMRNRVSIPIAVSIAQQLSESLCEAHRAGIIHGYLEPRTILISPGAADLSVKIRGYGNGVGYRTYAGGKQPLGRSPAFVPPEQVSRTAADAQADLYSLGAIVFQLVSGKAPHDDPDPLVVLRRKGSEPAPSLAIGAPQAPERLVELVDSLLDRDKAKRPQNAEFVATQLSEVASELGLPTTRQVARPARSPNRRRTIAMALALGLIIGVGAALLARPSYDPHPAQPSPRPQVEHPVPELPPQTAPATDRAGSPLPTSAKAPNGVQGRR